MYKDFILVHKGKSRSEQCHDQFVKIRFSNITFSLYLVCTIIPIIGLRKGLIFQWYPAVNLLNIITLFSMPVRIVLALCTLAALQLSQVLVQESNRFRYIFLLETSRIIFSKLEDEPNIL